MPIRPENKARYPKEWPAIRVAILQRAHFMCEHPGCYARHGVTGYWFDGRFRSMGEALRNAGYKAGNVVRCEDGVELKLIKIVLTIAHLDHTPENCDPVNLRAWCQRHHLAYDAEHHRQTAYMTRRAARNTLELPL